MPNYAVAIIALFIFDLECNTVWAKAVASAVSAATEVKATTPWWSTLGAALVGAIAAIVTPFIKDLIIVRLTERSAERKQQATIFRNYVTPLSDACVLLLWRCNEIFCSQSHAWLLTKTLPLVYNDYKRESTRYRMATVLAWIRAIDLELTSLPRGSHGLSSPLHEPIKRFKNALASGAQTEIVRLERFCNALNVSCDNLSGGEKTKLARDLEAMLYSLSGPKLVFDSSNLASLEVVAKTRICNALRDFVLPRLKAQFDERVWHDKIDEMARALSLRESLIFTDWQNAIGDFMLVKDDDSVRRYKPISFEAFTKALKQNNHWLDALKRMLTDIDLSKVDDCDTRGHQLHELASATCDILDAVSLAVGHTLLSDDERKALISLRTSLLTSPFVSPSVAQASQRDPGTESAFVKRRFH